MDSYTYVLRKLGRFLRLTIALNRGVGGSLVFGARHTNNTSVRELTLYQRYPQE